jgi:hypothetical protein
MFGEHPASRAMTNAIDRLRQGLRKRKRAIAVTLKQIEGDPLRRFSAHTGHAAQCIDQADQ